MTRSERVYRVLLRAYPEHTRDAYGEDMVQLFRDRMRDTGSPLEQASVWIDAIADFAVTAPREYLARRSTMKSAEGPTSTVWRPVGPDLAVASLPLLLAAFLVLVLPGYYRPLFDDRVSILGLPAGVAMLLPSGILASFGIFEARRGDLRNPDLRALALAILLVPDLALIVLGVLPGVCVIYAVVMALFVEAARFRVLMLALLMPLAMVLLDGPALIRVMIILRV